jgi:pimeloyl-ACP methyl ester carboxylesterase
MDKTVLFRSSNVFYRTEGEGYPVVFVHGFAEDGSIWDNQAAFLSSAYRLIVPDLPGSGKSEGIDGKATEFAGMEDYADAIKAILDQEKVQSCVMFGHSMGGYIMLAFAEKYPEMTRAFGLIHSTAYADSADKINTRRKGIAFVKKHGAADFIKQSMPGLFTDSYKGRFPEKIRELIERYDNFQAHSLVSYCEGMIQRPDRTSVLRSFTGPVLFIIGEKDNAVPLEHSLQQSHIPWISFIHVIENAAHMGMLEATAEVNDRLLSFLKNVAL